MTDVATPERLEQVQARRRRGPGKEPVTGRPSTTFDHIDAPVVYSDVAAGHDRRFDRHHPFAV